MNTRRKGFTLVELITALAITAVIGYFFVSIGRDFAIAWDNVGDTVSRETEARSALDIITRDIEAAFFREGTDDVMLAIDTQDDASMAGSKWESGPAERPSGDGTNPSAHEYGWAGSWIRLFSAAPSFNAVGYRIVRTTIKDGVGKPRYMLYRNAATTLNTILVAETATFDAFNLAASTYLEGDYIKGTNRNNILAVNVIDFGARLYIYDDSVVDPSGDDAPDGLRLIFPADGSSGLVTSVAGLSHYAKRFDTSGPYNELYPDVVEVFLRILDEKGARELSDLEESGDNTNWEEIVAENSKLYRRFIVVGRKGGS